MDRDDDRDDLSAQQARLLGEMLDVYPVARELGERFEVAGHELYMVGGSVRDTLLDQPVPDLDFATSARPEQTESILRAWTDTVWLIGARFGTVSARSGDHRVEVTTYRTDAYEAGSRHPEVTYGDTIEGDLSRRDFTVNAMAVRVPQFRFVDPFGGLSDLKNKVLRTPVAPEQSFRDDPLRMVRLARFAAVLNARPEPATELAATQLADELTTVSAERIAEELSKLLVASHPAEGLDVLVRTGLAGQFLPELTALRDLQDPEHRHKDVYRHTLAVVERCAPDLVLRLAALLHDVAKPATRRIHPDGTVTFHHHEVRGARMARERLNALKFDKRTTADVAELVHMHLRFHTYRMGWTDSAVRRYVRDAGHLLDELNALTRADCTTRDRRKAEQLASRMDELEERIADLRQREELDSLRPALDGNAIMVHLGIPAGPDVGKAWRHLLELRIEQGPMTEDDAKAALDAWWAGQ